MKYNKKHKKTSKLYFSWTLTYFQGDNTLCKICFLIRFNWSGHIIVNWHVNKSFMSTKTPTKNLLDVFWKSSFFLYCQGDSKNCISFWHVIFWRFYDVLRRSTISEKMFHKNWKLLQSNKKNTYILMALLMPLKSTSVLI